jgi:hypothetical protein
MHDFGPINLKGLKAILKPRNFWKKPSTEKERTVVVIQGSGCNPDPAYGRKIECRTGPGTHETISSYDLEYVIKDGNKIAQAQVEAADAYVCTTAPTGPVEEANRVVRRKR